MKFVSSRVMTVEVTVIQWTHVSQWPLFTGVMRDGVTIELGKSIGDSGREVMSFHGLEGVAAGGSSW